MMRRTKVLDLISTAIRIRNCCIAQTIIHCQTKYPPWADSDPQD